VVDEQGKSKGKVRKGAERLVGGWSGLGDAAAPTPNFDIYTPDRSGPG
jgi:hypothetical protein